MSVPRGFSMTERPNQKSLVKLGHKLVKPKLVTSTNQSVGSGTGAAGGRLFVYMHRFVKSILSPKVRNFFLRDMTTSKVR